MDGSPLGSSIHGISQARIQEWVAISFSRGSSLPRDQTLSFCVSCIGNWILYHCTTWEALKNNKCLLTQRVGSGIWEQHSSAILLQDLPWCCLNPSHQKAWLALEDPVHMGKHTHTALSVSFPTDLSTVLWSSVRSWPLTSPRVIDPGQQDRSPNVFGDPALGYFCNSSQLPRPALIHHGLGTHRSMSPGGETQGLSGRLAVTQSNMKAWTFLFKMGFVLTSFYLF